MPRGRTEEGFPCKYAPYYRGYYASKRNSVRLEEEEQLSSHMKKAMKKQERKRKVTSNRIEIPC